MGIGAIKIGAVIATARTAAGIETAIKRRKIEADRAAEAKKTVAATRRLAHVVGRVVIRAVARRTVTGVEKEVATRKTEAEAGIAETAAETRRLDHAAATEIERTEAA